LSLATISLNRFRFYLLEPEYLRYIATIRNDWIKDVLGERFSLTEIRALFEQARDEDVIVRLADGSEFILSAIDEFDVEVAQTRRTFRDPARLVHSNR
jgi:hypothetical protein